MKYIFQVILDRSQTDFEVGHIMTLTCEVVGFPVPVVKWYKNNMPLPKSDRFHVDDQSRLTVKKLTVIDGGVYACRATNRFQSVSESIKVTVKEGVTPPPDCEDDPNFARCDLIVRANYCKNPYYGKFCCKTCTEGGQLKSGWEEIEAETEKAHEAEKEKPEFASVSADEPIINSYETEDEASGGGSSSEVEEGLSAEPEQSGHSSIDDDEVLEGSDSERPSTKTDSKVSENAESSSEVEGSAKEEGSAEVKESSGELETIIVEGSSYEFEDGMSGGDEGGSAGKLISQTESGDAPPPHE